MKHHSWLTIIVIVIATGVASGQVATGTPAFGSFGGGPFDTVNLGNLNVAFVIPVLNKAGRGTPFAFNLVYNSSIWQPVTSNGTTSWNATAGSWGWSESLPSGGRVSYTTSTQTNSEVCGYIYITWYNNWTYYDGFGTPHVFPGSSDSWTSSPGCNSTGTEPLVATATDGSGYTLSVNGNTITSVTSTKGAIVNPVTGSYSSQDANGNLITAATVSGTTTYTDTLNTTALTISGSGTPSSPIQFSYTAPGGTAAYKMNYTQYTVQTNFSFSSIVEYGRVSNSLVSSVQLPDNSQYTFVYEQTPGSCTPLSGTYSHCVTGRIASITLPTGGAITYTYTGGPNNTGIFSDGSTAVLTRALSPGGSWTYLRTNVSGTPGPGSAWTTQITDSASNQTMINFAEDATTTTPTYNVYETQRLTYSGSISGGTLLSTTITCYNNTNPTVSACPTASVSTPISNRTIFNYLPNASGQQSKTFISYYAGTAGYPSEVDTYNFGNGTVGSLATKVLTNYTTSGPLLPSSVTVEDGSSKIWAATTFRYDESSVTTTGATQHVSVSGGRGNLTTVAAQVNSTQTLYQQFDYYDTGMVKDAYDFSLSATTHGPTTSFVYDNSGTPPKACDYAFPTTVNLPNGLSRSMGWNCTGGLQTSVTDENGQVTSVAFTDTDFWRPASTTDPLAYVTSITYPGTTIVTSSLPFNGTSSVAELRTQVDGLGRPYLSQRRQAPGSPNYDTVETDYTALGPVSKVTIPFSAAAGGTSSTAPGTSSSYDALGRALTVSDSGGGFLTYNYYQNDVMQTISPAPTGETAKSKQSEYDALSRLISVCEVTTVTGSGNCAQNNPQTGYWTKYTYDPIGDLTGVTQNAQAGANSQQSRTYSYDMIGRILTEINPETGTTTYAYDTDAACGTTSYPGNMVKRVDANGNVTCYAYDKLQRVVRVSYLTGGPNTANTPTKTFVYGTAQTTTVNGVTLNNTANRMVEAYTCFGSCTSKSTDLLFNYSPRGEVVDAYESTPNSGAGYYDARSQYWANGAVNTLSLLNAGGTALIPAITYGADTEGRASAITAASGTNPVYSTSYNTASQVTGVTYMASGSDNDAFTFDPNTLRLTDYQFNVGSPSKQNWGHLNWNQNGSLGSLAITDPLNTGNSQTCTYTYDDLGRLASKNPATPNIVCGTKWSQTITLDAFGNISKAATVGTNFQASYIPSSGSPTNRIVQIGSLFPSYDANGDILNDTAHQYTWDAEGKMLTIDNGNSSGVCLTYDALGRMVEQGRGATCAMYTQIAYSAGGSKLALLNGQTLQKAFVPLTGGGTAVYNASGLQYFRHTDALGSSRMATTPNRAMYYDTAYAPYGEDYKGKVGTGGAVDLSFTGQNEDTTSWMYDAMFRQYNQTQGRWMSPDPAGLTATDPASPQTWNRYGYVANIPDRAVDPLGLRCKIYVLGVKDNLGQFSNNGIPNASAVYPFDGLGLVGGSLSAFFGAAAADAQGLVQLLQQYQGEPGGVDLIGWSGGAQVISNVIAANQELASNVVSTTYLSPGLGPFWGAWLYQGDDSQSFKGSGIVDFAVTLGARMQGVSLTSAGKTGHRFVKELNSPAVKNRLSTLPGGSCGGGGGGGGGGYGYDPGGFSWFDITEWTDDGTYYYGGWMATGGWAFTWIARK